LVEVESADPACSVDGPSLGPPLLPVRPRSRPAVCAVVENGATTGAMTAGTDASSSIVVSSGHGRSGGGSCRCCFRRVLPPARRGSGQHAAGPSRGVARRRLPAVASGGVYVTQALAGD
jgi:hypothetical protein